MDLGLEGKSVLVTAATRGLGRASALELAAEGSKVAVAGRDMRALRELAAIIDAGPGEALALPLDLTDLQAPGEVIDEVVARWGALDAAVINGPGPIAGPVTELTDDDWDNAMATVLMPAIRLLRAAGSVMASNGGGRITIISTIGVRTVQPGMALSNSTRLALMGVAKTLSVELAPDNVVVNQVAPGPIATDRMDDLIAQTARRDGVDLESARQVWLDEVPMQRMGRPEDVAALVAFLSSERCAFTTGAVIPVDGGKAGGY